jgi:CheY-like chemotaxis protein
VLGAASPVLGMLIVDDEAYMRGLLQVAMRQEGVAVWLAADGHEALAISHP